MTKRRDQAAPRAFSRAAIRAVLRFTPLFVLLAAFFASCSSTPQTPQALTRDYAALKRGELDALSLSDPEACLETISILALMPSGGAGGAGDLDGTYLSALSLSSAEKIAALLTEALQKGDFRAADGFLASLKALAAAKSEVFAEAAALAAGSGLAQREVDLYLALAEESFAAGLYAPAAAYFHRALDAALAKSPQGQPAPVISLSVLNDWLARAEAVKDYASARRILSFLPDAAVSEALRKSLSATIDIDEKVGGVVTVYVDRGLRIEKGLGYPDRILGTAFQVDARGYYITNYHVIASEVDPDYNGYSRLSIRPSGNPDARVPAKVIGWDEELDLALLKSQEISPLSFYPFSRVPLFKGQKIYAVGSPVGLENSVSAGIVSSTGRRILPIGEAIQIDAPVNPGNSGGPLLDEQGNLVGVVFAGLASFQGLNFALPASWLAARLPALFREGRSASSWLSLGIAKNLDASFDISYVFPGRGGAMPGDRLLSIDGVPARGLDAIHALMARKPSGSLCALELERQGQKIWLLRKTETLPASPLKLAVQRDSAEQLLAGTAAMMMEHVSGPRGVGGVYRVTKAWPGGPADESGIGEASVLQFLKYTVDSRKNIVYFDVRVKSPASGYLERAMRIGFPLKMSFFL